MAKTKSLNESIPCCPQIVTKQACNVLDFNYRLERTVPIQDGQRSVRVEIGIKARMEICRGDLSLGKLAYSTTLFPGEKVRLFTLDRRNRFSFDSESQLSYRQQQAYEEQFYLSSFNKSMSDLTVTEHGKDETRINGSSENNASASGVFGAIVNGPSGSIRGSYDAFSSANFLRELSQHAESSHYRSVESTHTVNSVSIGEVNQRLHTEGESEDHFESASRSFENKNRCHAVTYFFYQINQEQVVRFTIEAINRRVIDPAANTEVSKRPSLPSSKVEVIPNGILATNEKRVAIENAGKESLLNRVHATDQLQAAVASTSFASVQVPFASTHFIAQPLTVADKKQALSVVDNDLVEAGLISKETGKIADNLKAELSFERVTQLPTGGVYVQSCLDNCSVCEPGLEREIELELEHKMLQNQLLKKQIELLEKSGEYRCCPEGEKESE